VTGSGYAVPVLGSVGLIRDVRDFCQLLWRLQFTRRRYRVQVSINVLPNVSEKHLPSFEPRLQESRLLDLDSSIPTAPAGKMQQFYGWAVISS
jgi:hypothetical protein